VAIVNKLANYQSPGPQEAQMDNGTSSNVFLTMLLAPMLPLEAKASEKRRKRKKKSDPKKKKGLRAYKVR
jgi:hypothetical protein